MDSHEDVKLQVARPGTQVANRILHDHFIAWWDLFVEKNRGYGERCSSGDDLGIKATIPDINRKFLRVKEHIWFDKPWTGSESVEEVINDLIGHLFMLIDHLATAKLMEAHPLHPRDGDLVDVIDTTPPILLKYQAVAKQHRDV